MCLAIFGVPIILAGFGLGQILKEREEVGFQAADKRVELALARIENFKDTFFAMKILLLELGEKTFPQAHPFRRMRIFQDRLRQRFPGVFEFIVLDQSGTVIPHLSDGDPPRRAMKLLFQACTGSATGNNDLMQRNWSVFRTLLGPMVKRENMHPLGEFHLATHKKERAYVFVSKVYPTGQLIAFVNQTEDWNSLVMADQMKKLNRNSSHVKVGIADREVPTATNPRLNELPQAHLDTLIQEFENSTRNQRRQAGFSWGHRFTHPTIRLVAACPLPVDVRAQSQRFWFIGLMLVAFSAACLVTLKLMKGEWQIFVSIRRKLIFLFAYAAGIPLAIMGINALAYISERHSSFESLAHQEMEQRLKLFDKKVYTSFGILQEFLRGRLARPILDKENPQASALAIIQAIGKRLKPSTLLLIDDTGKGLYELNRSSSEKKERGNKFLMQFYGDVLKSLNNTEVLLDNAKKSAISELAAVGGIDMDAIFSDVLRSMRTVANYQYGSRKAVQAIFPLYDRSGRARFLAVFAWMQFNINRAYVNSFLRKAALELPDTELYAYNSFYPTHSKPANFRYLPLMTGFMHRLKGRQILREKMVRHGETLLFTGVKGEEMPEYYLTAVTSDRKIRRELRQLKRQLGMLSLALIAVSMTVGSLLARSFLRPVSALAEGVDSLRRRNFKHRVPVLERDEFGDLSTTFNDVMESLEDLELARIIQEALFPGTGLNAPPYQVFGRCVPATQVGGDYFDYFPTASGDIMIILGDVAGHGVPAAIVMGMAKALAAHPATPHDPASLLAVLNEVMAATLKRKKMMTCFCALVKPSERRILFCNAGQNFPILLRGEKIEYLKSINFLLGTGKRAVYANLEQTLQPDDLILFYSDGIIEATARDGKEIGYERLEAVLPSLKAPSAQATEKAIRNWYHQTVAPGPQGDDISLIVLQDFPKPET
jgi:HAMP domain-containing protein